MIRAHRLAPHVLAGIAWVLGVTVDLNGAPRAMASSSTGAPVQTEEATASPAPFAGAEIALGDGQAPNTVVEYLSVTCSHCAAFDRDTWPRVERELVETGRVRFIVREMPTAPVAVSAAGFLLARCKREHHYWETVRALLAQQLQVLAAPTLEAAIAEEAAIAGLDPVAARECLQDAAAIAAINDRREQGLLNDVDSTPYFIVNGQPLRPGARLGGAPYGGGELSFSQLLAALRAHASYPNDEGREPKLTPSRTP